MARKPRSSAPRAAFKLTSRDIKPNGPIAMEQVFNGFGCSGQNISPALKWSGAVGRVPTLQCRTRLAKVPTWRRKS